MIYSNEDFIYVSTSGRLFHARYKAPNARAGSECTTKVNSKGYLRAWYKGELVQQHRLAWYLVHGYWPEEIDHINGNKSDNRLCNLREVNREVQMKNLPKYVRGNAPLTGVSIRRGRYRASIQVSGVKHQLGTFDSLFEAVCARKSAEVQYRFHPNHGRA